MSCSLAFLLFNFYLLIFKVNPCRFSIFYCGCKQPKSVHIYWKRMQRYAFFPKPTQFFAKTFNATTKTTMKTADSIVINNHRWHKWTQIVFFSSSPISSHLRITTWKVSIVLALYFICAEPLVRRKPIIFLIQLKCRALGVIMPNLRHRIAEGSPIR